MRLISYVRKSLSNCPGNSVKVETATDPAPAGFTRYRAIQTSSDPRCGRRADVLVHDATKSVMVGDVFPLPADPRPLEARVADLTGRILRKQVQAVVEKSAASDGSRKTRIITSSRYGPFAFSGWTDQQGRFFWVGRRGALASDPGKTLLDSLQVSTGAHFGTKGAPIQIVELSDLQCPTCRRAHERLEPILKQNASRISYTRLDLPLFEGHDWTITASLAARAIQQVAPAKYWQFVDYIFDNQESIQLASIDNTIRDWVEGNGVDLAKFTALWKSDAELKKLLDHTGRVYDASINSTPTFVINGQVTPYGGDGAFVLQQLNALLAAPAAKPAAAKPAAAKKPPAAKKPAAPKSGAKKN